MFIDFSKLPSDVALFLSQQEHTQALADGLAAPMRLDLEDRDVLHQEIIGAVAKVVDNYLAGVTDPKANP